MRAAAIGIGSNSLRMLVADIQDAQLRRIHRDREGLRVFAALDAKAPTVGELRLYLLPQPTNMPFRFAKFPS